MVTDDPLLVRWGLHDLLEGYSGYSSAGVGRTSVQTNDHARTEFVQPGESYTVRGYSSVENDELIAHALQEELAAEGSEKAQDWCEWAGPFADTWSAQNDYDSTSACEYDSGQESEDDGVPEFSEDFATYDGEVGRRLTHMDSVPHVPRINGEIPTIDDASAAHQRLFDRLKQYGLSELKVDGDGNCQLTSHPEFYEGYVPMKYSDYVKKMARSGEWGDHVTLQAAADFYGVRICLLTSFKDTSFVQILPRQSKSKRVIHLSFWAEVHYNSVYPAGDIPRYSGHKKKGKHWRQYFKDKLKI
ncbi:hypothetical protein GOP47_0014761 [Adiantum capillus-veneris]|uniref:OTU domain-containing protein n=1 Tax=Adiantum capillus-veneris TaxID=13818 RepID=A0A9D4ZCG8_ADICA|nr:hypothetical protein GOP47_0014761 [Adiantum capillus-veneris]